jgi:predicted phage-related endonuclease
MNINTQTAIAIAELTRVRKEQKSLKAREDELRKAIVTALNGETEAIHDGLTVAKLVTVARTDIDRKALAELFPQAYEATLKHSTHTRLDIA